MDTLKNRPKTFPLKHIPKAVHDIAKEEQLRLEREENLELKLEQVYYRIVQEWKKYKHAGT